MVRDRGNAASSRFTSAMISHKQYLSFQTAIRSRSIISSTNMSLKDLPHSHFKVAVEELNHRYKVCIALGSLVEEVAEVGSSAGKSLSKVCL